MRQSESEQAERRPVPGALRMAAVLVLAEGLLAVGFGVAEAVNIHADRVALGATTALFFVLYGAALGACAWGMVTGRSWSRSPVVLAQLIFLGLAWNLREVPAIASPVTVVAALVLLGTLLPASMRALNRDGHDQD